MVSGGGKEEGRNQGGISHDLYISVQTLHNK